MNITLFILYWVYPAIFLAIFFTLVKNVRSFYTSSRNSGASILLDRQHLIIWAAFNVISFAMLVGGIAKVKAAPAFYEENAYPLVLYTLPIMTSLSSVILKKGLYSYTSYAVFCGKEQIGRTDITLRSVAENRLLHRTKVVFTRYDKDTVSNKRKYTVYTAADKARAFEAWLRG